MNERLIRSMSPPHCNVTSMVILGSLLFCAATIFPACSGGGESSESLSTEQRYERGMAEMADKDYMGAILHFETLLLQDPAHELADDAQFQLGEAYYAQGEYYTAAFQYSRVLTEFRGSPHYRRALFKTGESYFALSPKFERDQKRTSQAIRQYEAFLQYFPNDTLSSVAAERIVDLREKLARRDFEIAKSYFERERYKAAEIYYQRVVDMYGDTSYASLATEALGRTRALLIDVSSGD